jgi:hypothetical protein
LGFFKGEIKMGRPLKIQKLNNGVQTDAGYPSFDSMDPGTAVIPAGMTGTEFLGVVGGQDASGIATAAYPITEVVANLPGGQGNAYIVTQKGVIKYLVSGVDSVNAGSFTAGFAYLITALGNTDWTAIGAGINPQVGQVFTATGAGSGSGTASDCGQCVLVPSPDNSTTPTLASGQMYIAFSPDGGGTTLYASKLTNKYIWDSATPQANKYAVNFFTGNAVTAGSGADIATWTNGTGNYSLAVVNNFTS